MAEKSQWESEVAETGQVYNDLEAHEKAQLMHLYREATARGVDLKTILAKIVESPVESAPKLTTVIDDLVKVKTDAQRAKSYVTNLKNVLGHFCKGRGERPVNQIGVGDVEAFLDTVGVRSRPTVRSRLSTLFKYSMRRHYRKDNPCEQLEPLRLSKTPPQVFTRFQVELCVTWLRANAPHALGWFALTTFCGLRPEEAEKTTKADIHGKEGWIKVEAQTTKVRQRRVVYPKSEAMAFLRRVLKKSRLPIGGHTARRIVQGNDWEVKEKGTGRWLPKHSDGLRDVLKLDAWPKDITRHTAASYWLADCRSVADVATSLGNSEGVLKRHYMALVTKAQAQEFWERVKTL